MSGARARRLSLLASRRMGWVSGNHGRYIGCGRSSLRDHDTIQLGRFVFIFRDLASDRADLEAKPAYPLQRTRCAGR